MKKLIALLFVLFTLALAAVATAAPAAEKIGSTASGDVYLDTASVQPLRRGQQMFLLLQAEIRYNAQAVAQLQSLQPELATATAVTQLYLYNNDGTQAALLKSLYTDNDDKVVYSVDGNPTLQPVKSSLQMQLYEKALAELERQKRISDMLRKK